METPTTMNQEEKQEEQPTGIFSWLGFGGSRKARSRRARKSKARKSRSRKARSRQARSRKA